VGLVPWVFEKRYKSSPWWLIWKETRIRVDGKRFCKEDKRDIKGKGDYTTI